MGISQRKLAQALGVSPMAVSRALRGEAGVGDALRARILTAADERGCPRRLAGSRPGERDRRRVFGVLVDLGHAAGSARQPGDMQGGWTTVTDPGLFHTRLVEGMRRGAVGLGGELLVCDETRGAWPQAIATGFVDGIIMPSSVSWCAAARRVCPVPAVSLFHERDGTDMVTVNNFRGGYDLGRLVSRLGHRRGAYIGSMEQVSLERFGGFRAALEEAGGGVPPERFFLHSVQTTVEDSIVSATQRFLAACGRKPRETHRHCTVLFVYNDAMAVTALQVLRDARVRVPQDLSVVAFDNARVPGYQGPALTTCDVPLEAIGEEAVGLLQRRIDMPAARPWHLVLNGTIVPGQTAGPPVAAS